MSGKHDLEDCWAQFLNDWPRVEHPGDVDVEALAREMAAGAPHPACAALGFTKPPLRVLIGLCEKLQEAHGGAMFYLACRKAADALTAALGESIDKTACCEYLGALVAAGVLEVVKRGTTKRATRYRFVWRPGPAVAGDRPDWLRDGAKTSDESTGGQNT